MEGAIADGQAAPKGQPLDLTNAMITTKRCFGGRATGHTSWVCVQTLFAWAGDAALGALFGPVDLTGILRQGGPVDASHSVMVSELLWGGKSIPSRACLHTAHALILLVGRDPEACGEEEESARHFPRAPLKYSLPSSSPPFFPHFGDRL